MDAVPSGPANPARLAEYSKRVFNRRHHLSIALAFTDSRDGVLSADEVVAKTTSSPATVHHELQVLVMMAALQRVQIERRVYYQRVDGPYWDWVVDLAVLAGGVGDVSQPDLHSRNRL